MISLFSIRTVMRTVASVTLPTVLYIHWSITKKLTHYLTIGHPKNMRQIGDNDRLADRFSHRVYEFLKGLPNIIRKKPVIQKLKQYFGGEIIVLNTALI